MSMTRRGFATAGVLALGAVAVPSFPFTSKEAQAQGKAKGRGRPNDPLLAQVHAEVRDLAEEIRTKPNGRKGAVRTMEAWLKVASTHMAQHYDADIHAAIAQAIRNAGSKTALVAKAMQASPQSTLTIDQGLRSLAYLEDAPIGRRLRDVAASLATIRAKMPDDGAYRPVIYISCDDILRTVEDLEGVMATLGAFAIIEPTPLFETGFFAAFTVWLGYKTYQNLNC